MMTSSRNLGSSVPCQSRPMISSCSQPATCGAWSQARKTLRSAAAEDTPTDSAAAWASSGGSSGTRDISVGTYGLLTDESINGTGEEHRPQQIRSSAQVRGRAFEPDLATLEEVRAVRDVEREVDMLFHEHDRHAV